MPTINASTPTVNIALPVPGPANTARPKSPAPAPVAPQPVPAGGVAPAIPPAPPPTARVPHAIILPWVPPAKKVPVVPMRRRYNRNEFHAAIDADPAERTTHLAYADWLDENDKPDLAAFHRLLGNQDTVSALANKMTGTRMWEDVYRDQRTRPLAELRVKLGLADEPYGRWLREIIRPEWFRKKMRRALPKRKIMFESPAAVYDRPELFRPAPTE